jgi:hypothetical protein
MTRVLKINHLAVEPVLPALWPMLWQNSNHNRDRSGAGAGAGVGTGAAEAADVEFWQVVVPVYGRLRQVDTLLETIFTAVGTLTTSSSGDGASSAEFDSEVLFSFALCFQSLPEGQLAAVWDGLLDQLETKHSGKDGKYNRADRSYGAKFSTEIHHSRMPLRFHAFAPRKVDQWHPLGCSLLLPVGAVNSVRTLKVRCIGGVATCP